MLEELPGAFEPRVIQYPPDRVLGYEELVSHAEALLPSGRRFALVGESFSGPLALRIAAKQPPGLIAVVLVASFHRRPITGWLSALRPVVSAIFSRPAPAAPFGTFSPDLMLRTRWLLRFAMRRPRFAPTFAARVRAALRVDATDALAACPVPILYLGGSEDRLLRRTIPDDIRKIQQAVEIRVLPAPHLVLQRQPREAAAALCQFLTRAGREDFAR